MNGSLLLSAPLVFSRPMPVRLLAESLRQGQDFGIRRRVHYFTDWQPLKDYPALKQLLEPRD